jgi:hypothetical protein
MGRLPRYPVSVIGPPHGIRDPDLDIPGKRAEPLRLEWTKKRPYVSNRTGG